MKKLFKSKKISNIFFFILGAIIFGSIGITANYLLRAEDVEYVDKDNNTMTVQSAITDLYSKASGSKLGTIDIGDATVSGFTVSVPYTGSYSSVNCVYGTSEDYGNIGTISGNKCTFVGSSTTYYYKFVATDNKGKIYENSGNIEIEGGEPLSIVNVGDWVTMTPTSESYTVTSSNTGCGFDSVIHPNLTNKWRVIKKNDDGTVDMISPYVEDKVGFCGTTGYQKYVNTLELIAQQYTNSSFVERTRHMGYNGQTKTISNTTRLTLTTAPWTASTSTSTTNANEGLGAGDMKYTSDIDLVTETLGLNVTYKHNLNLSFKYWLASRYYEYVGSDYWIFNGRVVVVDRITSIQSLYIRAYRHGDFSDNAGISISNSAFVRPIVTLKANLKITGGDGSSEANAYTLG